MEAFTSTLVAYALTIVFAMIMAGAIQLLTIVIKKFRLQETESPSLEPPAVAVPRPKLRVAIALAAIAAQNRS